MSQINVGDVVEIKKGNNWETWMLIINNDYIQVAKNILDKDPNQTTFRLKKKTNN